MGRWSLCWIASFVCRRLENAGVAEAMLTARDWKFRCFRGKDDQRHGLGIGIAN
jgi:hypothetical protein